MPLYPATEADLAAIAELVNAAYRGDDAGWTSEGAYMGGSRTDAGTLRRDLAANPDAQLLTLRDGPDAPLLGCVWLEPAGGEAWYLGMLTVRTDLQDRRLGRDLLLAAETVIAGRGARRVRMTVINVRTELIAWYERRGYARTGEILPFPYEDCPFGVPRRPDLSFVVLARTLAAEG
jgi:ribosomal protein S18 acetylase RimI-like enzyme